MKYSDLRGTVKSGDIFMVEGTSFISRAIRISTGQNISHVGMFLWLGGDNLFIVEQREFKAFQMSRASDRLQRDMKGCRVYYGMAPDIVRSGDDDAFIEDIFSTRNEGYGYSSLLKVLYAQYFNKEVGEKNLVCSTWVQNRWIFRGYENTQILAPGSYMYECQSIKPLDLQEYYKPKKKEKLAIYKSEVGTDVYNNNNMENK